MKTCIIKLSVTAGLRSQDVGWHSCRNPLLPSKCNTEALQMRKKKEEEKKKRDLDSLKINIQVWCVHYRQARYLLEELASKILNHIPGINRISLSISEPAVLRADGFV